VEKKSDVWKAVGEEDEFAHEGGGGGCFWFAGCAEALIERDVAGGDGGGRAQEKEHGDGQGEGSSTAESSSCKLYGLTSGVEGGDLNLGHSVNSVQNPLSA